MHLFLFRKCYRFYLSLFHPKQFFFNICKYKVIGIGRRKNHSKDIVHPHNCFLLPVEQWLMMFLSCYSSLKSCPALWMHPLLQPHYRPLPFPIHSIFLSANGQFCSSSWYQVLKEEKKIIYFLTLHSHLKSLPSSPCSHPLTTSPGHLWPLHPPSHFIVNFAWVRGMIHGIIKLRVGKNLKGQLI